MIPCVLYCFVKKWVGKWVKSVSFMSINHNFAFFTFFQLQRIDAVILLNWHIRILEKQIEYGSQLGDTVLQLARMELKNYSKNVLSGKKMRPTNDISPLKIHKTITRF
jgi:hypothetical protein